MIVNTIKWIASVSVLIAAVSIIVYEKSALYVWPFIFYTIGSFCWLIAGIQTKDVPLALLNSFFVVVNIYGIIIRII